MSYIVEDLLVAARVDAKAIAIKSDRCDLVAELATVVGEWERFHPGRRIGFDHPDPELFVTADAARVRQIVRNLISNADKYGKDPITVTARQQGQSMVVQVCDSGPGISDGFLEHAFELYSSLSDRTGLTVSIGLGLYVSRHLARLLDGELSYSRIDGQTVFDLTLPVRHL